MKYLSNKVNVVLTKFCNGLVILFLSFSVNAKEVIGWIEDVGVSTSNILVKAKIDTGADSSSMHCDCIKTFKRDGDKWVKFTITDVNGKDFSFEKEILRTVKVKRHSGNSMERYVVRMGLCIGGEYEETDVSLVDRSGFKYDLLIGRKYLADKFIVDPGQKLITSPQCKYDQ